MLAAAPASLPAAAPAARAPWRRRLGLAALVALALLVLVVAMLARLPAAFALRLAGPLPAGVEATDPRGTVWDGQLGALRVGGRDLGALRWTLAPAALLRGAPSVDLALEGPARADGGWRARGTLARAGDAWRLTDATVELPASLIDPGLAALGLRADGRLHLAIDHVELAPPGIASAAPWPRALLARAEWREARVAGAGAAALGTLSLDLLQVAPGATGAGTIEGVLADAGGPLLLAGGLQADPAGWRLDAVLGARDPALTPSLALIGQPLPDGRRRLRLDGGWHRSPAP
jgi:hypothetical protein